MCVINERSILLIKRNYVHRPACRFEVIRGDVYLHTFVLIICMRAEAELSHRSPRFPQTLVSVTANGESRLLLTSQLITRRFHRRNVARVKVRTSGLFERKIRTRIIIALCLDGFLIINRACSMNKKKLKLLFVEHFFLLPKYTNCIVKK